MTPASSTVQTRRIKPSHTLWKPHNYQARATKFLSENGAGALFADPGTGKTSIVLNVFTQLKEAGVVDKMLVIAPRRVCQLVWWQESQQWSQFRHLKFAWLHNSRAPWAINDSPKKKDAELEKDADIYLINPEGVSWLHKKYYNTRTRRLSDLPFDTVVVDELTKFKNARSKRSKHLRQLTTNTARLWGLTGSPTPNGYEDLFGQMLLLDGGVALGKYYTHFRDKYFKPDGFNGFNWKLAPGADKRIEDRIAHMVLRIDANDFLDMPEIIPDPIKIRLDDKARAAYDKLKKDMLLRVDDGDITAANAAALYSKLAQLANGAVYIEGELGEKKTVHHVHDAKLDALEDLHEGLGGAQLLVGYEFNHDVDRLRERFPDIRVLGKGVSDQEVSEIERMWNAGEIDMLACHPASAGHGLNLQKGGAHHVCWFSATWDFELWDQFIRRLLRQGNESDHVINHVLMVEDSIDELKYEAINEKDMTQERFLQAINTAFGNDVVKNPAAGSSAATVQENEEMAVRRKLSKKADPVAEAAEEAPKTAPRPAGWGKATEETDEDEAQQREAIAAKLRRDKVKRAPVETEEAETEEDSPDAKAAFSEAVQSKLTGDEAEEEAPAKVKRKSTKKTKAVEEPEPVSNTGPAFHRSIDITVKFDGDGDPDPIITGNIHGDFEEDEAVRLAELILAATNRVVDGLSEDDDE